MYDTKNDLAAAIRANATKLLQARLADAVDLFTQIKQAHWNVKGPNFIALHELFDSAAELGDADTADLFTEISRAIDKQLWFVEAHLQGER